MEILTDEAKKKKEEWLKSRIKLAEERGVIQCKYCGIYSGVYKVTLKKFILPKSKKKVYLCQRHWDKSKELDDVIWYMENPEVSGYNDMKNALEKKKQEELWTRKKRIIYISIISISVLILTILYIVWRICG
jgi:hypothetical protein